MNISPTCKATALKTDIITIITGPIEVKAVH